MAETFKISATAAAAKVANINEPLYTVDAKRKVFYLNITLLDASEAIKEKVFEKISGKKVDSGEARTTTIKDRFAGRIANRVSQRVTPSKIVPKISKKIVKLLPLKMRQKGIKIAAELAYVEGPYFVLELQVQHVDIDKLKESANNPEEGKNDDNKSISSAGLELMIAEQKIKDKEEELAREKADNEGFIARWVNWGKAKAEETALPTMVQKKIEVAMAEILTKKMAEKKIQVVSVVCPEEKQARYFFKQMKTVRPKEKSK